MPNPQLTDIPLPVKGTHEAAAFGQQPEATTRDALNVRSFDTEDEVLRVGQRPGLSKYFASAVNGTNPVQELAMLAEAVDLSTLTATDPVWSDDFESYTPGNTLGSESANWDDYTLFFDTVDSGGMTCTTVDAQVGVRAAVDSTAVSNLYVGTQDTGDVYKIVADFTVSSSSGTRHHDILLRVDSSSPDNNCWAVRFKMTKPSNYVVELEVGDYVAGAFTSDDSHACHTSSGGYSLRGTLTITVAGNTLTASVEFNTAGTDGSATTTMDSRDKYEGIGIYGDRRGAYWHSITVTKAAVPAVLRRQRIFAVSGGSIYSGYADGSLSLQTDGGTAMQAGGHVQAVGAYQDMFFTDGVTNHYQYWNHDDDSIDDWATDLSGGTLPQGSVDNSKACKYITLYRGRVVLYGLEEEPQNWFMSAVNDPFDWDYSPATTTATQAVAGNNSDAGEVGDVLTALCPYSDDVMLMGGDHTLWVMRGDPATGGVIDAISYQTGIQSSESFAWSPNGELFFFGHGTLWRMTDALAKPEPISRGRMDKTFGDIDPATYNVVLAWDVKAWGLHIFLIPTSQPSSAPEHWWWDARIDAFWKQQYPVAMGPRSVLGFDGTDVNDQALLLGGWDSYIRQTDPSADDDDSTNISSYVTIGPLQPFGPLVNGRVSRIETILSGGSSNTSFEVHADDTPEDVAASSTALVTRTITSGRSRLIERINGNAFKFKLNNDGTSAATWACESITALTMISGRQRRGRL